MITRMVGRKPEVLDRACGVPGDAHEQPLTPGAHPRRVGPRQGNPRDEVGHASDIELGLKAVPRDQGERCGHVWLILESEARRDMRDVVIVKSQVVEGEPFSFGDMWDSHRLDRADGPSPRGRWRRRLAVMSLRLRLLPRKGSYQTRGR